MFSNRSVNVHQFAMVPRADIPRSSFRMQRAYKSTFGGLDSDGVSAGDISLLYPVFVEEVLPGDTFALRMTAFARLATPIFPVMDNLYLDSHFFFVPNRLVWENWQRFMGERDDPDSSVDFEVPMRSCPAGGYVANSIYDYMGLPCVGQVAVAGVYEHSALPLRGYDLIWNEWFRDQNIFDTVPVDITDGPDTTTYRLRPRRS